MASQEHLDILKQGVEIWNQWRRKHPDIEPDLSHANLEGTNLHGVNLEHTDLCGAFLRGADLSGANLNAAYVRSAELIGTNLSISDLRSADLASADLHRANFCGANLSGAFLNFADLRGADFRGANLSEARISGPTLTSLQDTGLSSASLSGLDLAGIDFSGKDLSGANFSRANLSGADLSDANLNGANLNGANLNKATLVNTNLTYASLAGCSIHGISAWNVGLEEAIQSDLVITPENEPVITVDNLKVAQFIYLLLNNAEIREVIDTIARKAVLILGRFSDERKMVLEVLKKELRNQNYSPVVFNIKETDNRDFTATVRTLANMARFVLIDLTDLNQAICEIADDVVPHCGVPIRPLLLQGAYQQQYELFPELRRKYRWVLAPYRYKDLSDLQISFQEKILQPINEKLIELKQKKPLKIFIAYAPEDKNTLNRLKIHLRSLEKAGLIELWDDQDVAPGGEKEKEIEKQLSHARIILLLISPAFLDSHNCYDIQMSRAIERYEQGEASVIPIILQPCAWKSTPLKELQPLPKDGKPVSKRNKDDVFFEMSENIGEVVKDLR